MNEGENHINTYTKTKQGEKSNLFLVVFLDIFLSCHSAAAIAVLGFYELLLYIVHQRNKSHNTVHVHSLSYCVQHCIT